MIHSENEIRKVISQLMDIASATKDRQKEEYMLNRIDALIWVVGGLDLENLLDVNYPYN